MESINTAAIRKKEDKSLIWDKIKKYRVLYLMLIPGTLCILIFCFAPMFGLVIAFKDYSLSLGVFGSKWVGLKHFRTLFSDPTSLNVIKNTLIISLYKLIFGLPMPIILALSLNEIGNKHTKNLFQTASYLPYFISWVIVAGMINNIFSPNGGVVPAIIAALTGKKDVALMTEPKAFRSIIVLSHLWKESGWSSIVYFAALAGIDVSQYEAATIDGASRFKQMMKITLPEILPLIVTVATLACGNILNAGFDQIFNMQNSMVMDVSDIIDTYVYRIGIVDMSYSFSSAVGLFKSLSGLILLLIVNFISKKATAGETGVW